MRGEYDQGLDIIITLASWLSFFPLSFWFHEVGHLVCASLLGLSDYAVVVFQDVFGVRVPVAIVLEIPKEYYTPVNLLLLRVSGGLGEFLAFYLLYRVFWMWDYRYHASDESLSYAVSGLMGGIWEMLGYPGREYSLVITLILLALGHAVGYAYCESRRLERETLPISRSYYPWYTGTT